MLRSLLGAQAAAASPPPGPLASSTGVSFASLLSAAGAGRITSDRPVEASPEVGGQLTAEQLGRVAVAADRAESAGMTTALVLIDGKAVQLDVLSREVTAVVDPRAVAVTGVDGVLAAPPSSLSAEAAGNGVTPQSPASLAGVLEQGLLAKLGSNPAGLLARAAARAALST